MDDVILLLIYLGVFAGALTVGGAIAAIIEAITKEWT